ncbi:MAG: nickel pincer cofactor biosynthesis protein LarB [Myxococcales bacterium]
MDPKSLKSLLERVARGETDTDAALTELRDLPFKDLGYASVDNHRALRVGIPEVVFGAGKTLAQLEGIVGEIDGRGQDVLITRLGEPEGRALEERFEGLRFDPVSRTATLTRKPPRIRGSGTIAVVTGGTSDIPVAEEAAVTAAILGNEVSRLYDVGVAGVHRLLSRRAVLDAASVVIVVAGMEGALASVVGGLVDKPVIAVPTSVGYGASLGGIAALLTMLNSCASGVTVVNIDNGFGAAYAATLINRMGMD